jgi:hypothetical protein
MRIPDAWKTSERSEVSTRNSYSFKNVSEGVRVVGMKT